MNRITILCCCFVAVLLAPFNQEAGAQSASIRNEIFSRIDGNPDFGPYEIEVDARYGTVTLSGAVATMQAKVSAERYARETKGVKEVVNHLEVRNTFAPIVTEERARALEQEIRLALAKERELGTIAINVSVERGVATLEGNVQRERDRDLVQDRVASIQGISSVINNLTVAPGISDGQLREKIANALSKDPVVSGSTVRIGVENGVVTLSGAVPNHRMRDRILAITLNIDGVKDIQSTMR